MKLSFENKHAIVCGGTDGIGKSTAELLAVSGCEVTLVAVSYTHLAADEE